MDAKIVPPFLKLLLAAVNNRSPINLLVPIPGTPLGDLEPIDPLELVRTIAVARILMPRSYVRLSAGRRSIGETGQALCFLAGANSIFYGDKLLTTPNPEENADLALLDKLGMQTAPGVLSGEASASGCSG